jgi:hypothetical protein
MARGRRDAARSIANVAAPLFGGVIADRLAVGSFAAIPLDELLVGPLADRIGVDAVLIGAAATIACACLGAALTPSIRHLTTDASPPAPQDALAQAARAERTAIIPFGRPRNDTPASLENGTNCTRPTLPLHPALALR